MVQESDIAQVLGGSSGGPLPSGPGHALQSQPVKAQPLPVGQTTSHGRQDSFQGAPAQTQARPPSEQESEWSRQAPAGSSQRPVSSNQQHERSFSSASMLNSTTPTASQPQFSNRNSMGPGGLLALQQPTTNSRYSNVGGPPQLGALSFQDSAAPPSYGPSVPLDDSAPRDQTEKFTSSQAAPAQEPSRPVFGVSLNRLYDRDGLAVPMVVYQCIQAVDLFGLNVEGIYRLSGSLPSVNKLKGMFDTGQYYVMHATVAKLITNMVQRYHFTTAGLQKSREFLPRCQQCGWSPEAILPGPA